MLSALSAYLLKSLRLDNGRAAKITLLGPGRAAFLSPNPRPQPIHPTPALSLVPAALLLPRCLHLCLASSTQPPRPRPPQGSACRAGRAVGPCSPLRVGMPGLVPLESWKLCVGGSSCVRPECHLHGAVARQGVELALPRACTSERPSAEPFHPQPAFETGTTKILLWGRLSGRRGGWGEPEHPLCTD